MSENFQMFLAVAAFFVLAIFGVLGFSWGTFRLFVWLDLPGWAVMLILVVCVSFILSAVSVWGGK